MVNPKPHTLDGLICDPTASHSGFFFAEFYSLLQHGVSVCEIDVEDFFVRLRLHQMHLYG